MEDSVNYEYFIILIDQLEAEDTTILNLNEVLLNHLLWQNIYYISIQ